MNRPLIFSLALLLLALLADLPAQAVDAPHYDPAAGFTCANCHIAQLTLGSTGYNNICLNCHRPGNPAAGSNPFTLADAADPFGTHSSVGTRRYQSSHRWDGPDTVPAAGAQPPLLGLMTTNTLRSRSGGQLACVRCHNQHYNTFGNFLRVANDQDQLCLDCHRSRDVSTHRAGSHPIGVDYDAAAAAHPGSFNQPVLNANPANPSSDLQARLNGSSRTLLCSTCHGVHFTDSHSGTVDGKAGFANLSASDGFLLRTDPRGARVAAGQPDRLNICTGCHAAKRSHNMKGQDVQCLDCHGAHVEYDPKDPANTKGTNLYLIRRNLPGAGQGQIFFRYTGSGREYVNAAGTGVCQGCHSVPPPGGIYPPEHASLDPRVCNGCHFHNNSSGSFSGSCITCHGNPPVTTALGGPGGLAAPATGALGSAPANAGAHAVHVGTRGMTCGACHNGYAGKAMPSQTIDIGFAAGAGTFPGFAGSVTGGSFTGNSNLAAGYSWSAGSGTTVGTAPGASSCSVYCHGSTLTGGAAPTPSWTGGPSQAACGSCHGASAAAPPTTGGHLVHAGAAGLALGCEQCHGAHPDSRHVSGRVKWDLTLTGGKYQSAGAGAPATSGATGAAAPSASYGSCSVRCHGSGTPVWGGTLWSATDQCAKCHSSSQPGAVSAATPFYGTSYPAKVNAASDPKVGAHTAHLTGAAGFAAPLACSDCHGAVTLLSATHMNGSTNFTWSPLAQSGGLSPSYDPASGRCSNVYCHGAGMPGGDSSGSNRAPTWNAPFLPATISAAACGSCHGFPPAPASGHPDVTVPAGFPTSAAIGTTCSCHPNINPAGNSYANIFLNKALHLNGSIEVSAGGSCDSCHGYPPAGAGLGGTQNNWSSARAENYPGGGGAHTIPNHVSRQANPAQGFANCSKCHNPADHAMSPIAFRPSLNVKARTSQGLRYASAQQARYSSSRLDGAAHLTGTCSNISCHFGASPKWDANL
jgi:predicted CxxxxCH...CXXCH cytochrome family protein